MVAALLLSVERRELEPLLTVEGEKGVSPSAVGLGRVSRQFTLASRFPPVAVVHDLGKAVKRTSSLLMETLEGLLSPGAHEAVAHEWSYRGCGGWTPYPSAGS